MDNTELNKEKQKEAKGVDSVTDYVADKVSNDATVTEKV